MSINSFNIIKKSPWWVTNLLARVNVNNYLINVFLFRLRKLKKLWNAFSRTRVLLAPSLSILKVCLCRSSFIHWENDFVFSRKWYFQRCRILCLKVMIYWFGVLSLHMNSHPANQWIRSLIYTILHRWKNIRLNIRNFSISVWTIVHNVLVVVPSPILCQLQPF